MAKARKTETPEESAAPATAPAIRFRDRIRELRRVKASDLADNPKNWRRHPDEQLSAMTAMMDRIGIAGAAVGREIDGKIELLDGHMRKSIAGDSLVPVLLVDLNDEEAALFLATADPLGDMAIADTDALHALLQDCGGVDDAFLRKMMADVEAELADTHKDTPAAKRDVEGMALNPHEHYDFLVVMAQSTHEWNVLCDKLGLKPEARRGSMGTARGLRAAKLIEKLGGVKA